MGVAAGSSLVAGKPNRLRLLFADTKYVRTKKVLFGNTLALKVLRLA